ncbi:MAG: DNA ligase D [Phycisphaerales bacterium]
MSLKRYVQKRNFSKTPEPSGVKGVGARGKGATKGKGSKGLAFVVQKHDATRLHYDFRLELDGVLKSWAVPKGPSLDPSEKRLAVEVEDHPIDYGGFEGVIPYGQYGGGTVMLWDRGTWEPLDADPAAALKKGTLKFRLHGERLKGEWALARMGGRAGGDKKNNWLLIKHNDAEAVRGGEELVARERTSIKSKRNLDEIASAGGQKRKRVSEGKIADPPLKLSPQLCTLADAVPRGTNWVHEIKFDGYRLLAHVRDGAVRLITRAGNDWTKKFRPIEHAISELSCANAVVDGEAVIVDEAGKTHFQALQQAIKERKYAALAFFVFDLLFLDGEDLRGLALLERKERLQKLLAKGKSSNKSSKVLRYSDHVAGSGEDVQQQACRLGLEGVVSKQVDAPYVSGRSRSWLKIKCGMRQEFVIVGYTAPDGARKHFGSLLLGAHDAKGKLVYTGKVGTGFSEAMLRDLGGKLRLLRVEKSALNGSVPREARGAMWVKPELVGEVAFTQWTEDKRLRHPAFEGLREDKPAKSVKIEVPQVGLAEAVAEAKTASAQSEPAVTHRGAQAKTRRGRSAQTSDGGNVVAGVAISHPERVVFPDCGVTKLDLARYYEKVSERILPFIADRPLSVVRCVRGTGQQCFFQKHLHETFSAPVKSIRVKEKNGTGDYIAVDSVAGLITLVQMGVIEIHPWGSKGKDLEHPDVLTFDLDPGEGVTFARIKEGVLKIRELLKKDGMETFLKTSGGKGLHVQVPIKPRATWEEAKEYAGDVARRLAAEEPEKYVAIMTKARRGGKIFVDYLRNGRGATSVAPYSVRARKGAPISMPLAWSKLDALESASEFAVAGFDGKERDVWEGFFDRARPLKAT